MYDFRPSTIGESEKSSGRADHLGLLYVTTLCTGSVRGKLSPITAKNPHVAKHPRQTSSLALYQADRLLSEWINLVRITDSRRYRLTDDRGSRGEDVAK